MKLFSRSVAVVLTPLLVVMPLWSQTAVPTGIAPATEASVQTLQLRLLDNDNPKATVNSQSAKGFTLQVVDPLGAPVSDAAIAVRLPDSGPTGAFADGSRSAVVYTDKEGRAQVGVIRWAATPGLVALRVTATKGDSHAGMLIEETLTAAAPVVPATAVAAALAPVTPAVVSPEVAARTVVTPVAAVSKPTVSVAQPVIPAPAPAPSVQVIAKNSLSTSAPLMPGTTAASAPAAQAVIPQQQPAVSVSTPAPGEVQHKSHAKWIIIALVAVGAGAGVAMVGKGKKSSSTPSAAVSVGSPSISVGGPQ